MKLKEKRVFAQHWVLSCSSVRSCPDKSLWSSDLRWVQVDNAEEAFKVMKLGKKNQSFSSTRLNHLSSRR